MKVRRYNLRRTKGQMIEMELKKKKIKVMSIKINFNQN